MLLPFQAEQQMVTWLRAGGTLSWSRESEQDTSSRDPTGGRMQSLAGHSQDTGFDNE